MKGDLGPATRRLALGAAALAVAAAVLLGDGDERRIRRQIDAVVLALGAEPSADLAERERRLERALSRAFSDDVRVQIPDYPSIGRGWRELGRIANSAARDGRGIEVRTSALELTMDPDERGATAQLRVELARPGDELHTDVRRVRLRFERRGDEWRATALEVSARTHAEPEARP